jgi:hypothetical protein
MPKPSADDIPEFLYHGTLAFHLGAIREDGLDPAHHGVNWGYSEQVVYLTRKANAAAGFAHGDNEHVEHIDVGRDGRRITVLRIDCSALDRNLIDFDQYIVSNFPDNKDNFQYAGIIPPAAISVVPSYGDPFPLLDAGRTVTL